MLNEKLVSMPAVIISRKVSSESVAGPRVQIILVLRIAIPPSTELPDYAGKFSKSNSLYYTFRFLPTAPRGI